MTEYFINIENQQDKFDINESKVIFQCGKMLNYVLKTPAILQHSVLNCYEIESLSVNADILICDNAVITEINRDYRGKDCPTDVISFALFADSSDSRIIVGNQIPLGEIIISVEKTQLQATENNKTFEEEFAFLLSHGILHLLGFDHQDDDSLEWMLDTQEKMINFSLESA